MAETQHTTDPVDPGDVSEGSGLTIGKVMVGAIVIASFGVWAYAYSGSASREAPDTLGDPSYAALAEPTCAAAVADLESLPNALVADSNVERAGNIRQANDLLTSMVNDLEEHLGVASVSLNERDDGITREWLADWRAYIADRDDYADRLEDDPAAILYVAAVGGERLERRITRFANTNLIISCVTPSDVG